MKKRKLNKKSLTILTIILLIILIEIVNPIKIYNKHLIKDLNYSSKSATVVLKNNLKDKVLKLGYNKALDVILQSSSFNVKNYSIYEKLNYYEVSDYPKQVNALIAKGYHADDINNILKSANDDLLKEFLKKDYDENISKYLQYDFSKLANYERYLAYAKDTTLEPELVVVYVNIGLDRDFYQEPNQVDDFSFDMLVNKYNKLPEDYVPNDLVTIDSKYAYSKNQKGNETMVRNFMKMSDDCKKEIGTGLLVRSGYRDYQMQQETYELYFDTYGQKYVDSYVALPGFSEHQTGLAVDIKAESSDVFAGTKESLWLLDNAYKYGFILRYKKEDEKITGVKYESWHYRYVGLEIAAYLKEHDMTYDEYYIRFLDK